MKVPRPRVLVNTYSKTCRIKRRHEVYLEDMVDAMASMPLARFATLDEAEAFASRVKALLRSVGVERRDDGVVVPRERWENGVRSIVTVLGWVSKSFEVREVVDRVERLQKLAIKAGVQECAICGDLELEDRRDDRTHLGRDNEGRLCHQRCVVRAAEPQATGM